MSRPSLYLVTALCVAVAAVTGGCGMEASDTQIRTLGEMGVPDDAALVVSTDEYVCPHMVPVSAKADDCGATSGAKHTGIGCRVDGTFGPYVPCGTVVQAGGGTCPNCGGAYRTELEGPPERPLAPFKRSSPFGGEVVDPVAILVKGAEDPRVPSRFALNQDPKTGRFFEASPVDVLTAVAHHEQVVSPTGVPIDPTMNGYKDRARGDVVVRNVDALEGPCWRCGGNAQCASCQGAGAGALGVFGQTPPECWTCADSGRCPECEGTGFASYEGGLPPTFRSHQVQGGKAEALPSEKRGWQMKSATQGEEDAGREE